MTTAERITKYAYRYWMRRGMTEWPTVRQAAHALSLRHAEIEEAGNGYDDFQLTQYFCCPPQPLAEHSIEAMIPEVDEAWRKYYAGA